MSLAMNFRWDYRGNRTALFDDVEEGGLRAAASYSSHEIDELENDRVLMLKRGNDMDSSRGILSGTMDKFKMGFKGLDNKEDASNFMLLKNNVKEHRYIMSNWSVPLTTGMANLVATA